MGGRFRIEEQLGKGRSGAVYEAFDTELNRQVAFRRFDTTQENLEDEVWRARFFDVVSDLSRISHANILSVLDAGIDEEGPYLVTAHVEGLRLSHVMKCLGQMKLSELYSLTTQVLDALHAAEEFGFYHHALSPSSVIATPTASGGWHYTLMDLGHSKLIPLVSDKGVESLVKTMDPALMAPEVFEGCPQGIRSTLYMFGQLLYWVAAGGHPLAGLSLELAHAKHRAGEIPFLRAYRADIPEVYRQWIYWLIQPDVKMRPKSVVDALRKLPSYAEATAEHVMPQPVRMDAAALDPNYDI